MRRPRRLGVPVLDRLAPGAARRAAARPTPPAWTSTTGSSTTCWPPASTRSPPSSTGTCRSPWRTHGGWLQPGHRRPLRRVRRPGRRPPRRPGEALDHPQRAVHPPEPRPRHRRARPRPGRCSSTPSRSPTTNCSGTGSRSPRCAPTAPAPVAIANNYSPVAGHGDTDADRAAAAAYDALHNQLFTDPLLGLGYPAGPSATGRWSATATWTVIAAPLDVLGVNYYNPTGVRARRGGLTAPVRPGAAGPGTRAPRSTGRWPRTGCASCSAGCATGTATRCRRSRSPRAAAPTTTSRTPTAGCPTRSGSPTSTGTCAPSGPRSTTGVDVPGLLRLVAAGQLGVGRGLHQALRSGARRLRHRNAHARSPRTPGSRARASGRPPVTTIDPTPASLPAALAEPTVPVRRSWIASDLRGQPRRLDGVLHPDPGAAAAADRTDRAGRQGGDAGRRHRPRARSPRCWPTRSPGRCRTGPACASAAGSSAAGTSGPPAGALLGALALVLLAQQQTIARGGAGLGRRPDLLQRHAGQPHRRHAGPGAGRAARRRLRLGGHPAGARPGARRGAGHRRGHRHRRPATWRWRVAMLLLSLPFALLTADDPLPRAHRPPLRLRDAARRDVDRPAPAPGLRLGLDHPVPGADRQRAGHALPAVLPHRRGAPPRPRGRAAGADPALHARHDGHRRGRRGAVRPVRPAQGLRDRLRGGDGGGRTAAGGRADLVDRARRRRAARRRLRRLPLGRRRADHPGAAGAPPTGPRTSA